jgi:hypothetical protein
MPFKNHVDSWSDIGMKLTIGVVNIVKICLLIVLVYFLVKVGFAVENMVYKISNSLPTWPAR